MKNLLYEADNKQRRRRRETARQPAHQNHVQNCAFVDPESGLNI
jgi:hypothetical protein